MWRHFSARWKETQAGGNTSSRNTKVIPDDDPKNALPPITVLVIQADDYDWAQIFSSSKLANGRAINALQTGWEDILVHSDTYTGDSRPIVEIRTSEKSKSKQPTRATTNITTTGPNQTVRPDFVLVRNEVLTPSFDGRSLLSGLLFASVPSVNSLESIHLFCDRATCMGFLHRLNRELGDDVFPVIPQHFCSGPRSLMYGNRFPAVVKVGSAHAGAGKMKIIDHHQMSDFRSILSMIPNQFCFAEPFIDGCFDLRIQKIGSKSSHYRAFQRMGMSGEWKTNTGCSVMEEIPHVEPRWKRWADEAAKMFGGLDILTVDAIVDEQTKQEWILEVNGTSSGLHPDCAEEDNLVIRDLVVEKMNSIFQ